MDSLLDFSKPMDVSLFDQVVTSFYSGAGGESTSTYQNVLVQFREHPMAWTRVDAILENSQNNISRVLALGILESTVQYKWAIMPSQQKDAIKTYIVNLIIKISQDPKNLIAQKDILTKLNMVLVQVVKHEWPGNWPTFIPDLVNSSKTSQSLCANNMHILQLLSEEIFEYGTGQMTSEKMKTMKKNLNSEFSEIYRLCEYILDHSNDGTLLSTTLKTLVRFLQWIPIGFIFETRLLATLVLKFLPMALFQNDVLECLKEIAALTLRDEEVKYNPKLVEMFFAVMSQVSKLITPDTDLSELYASSNNAAQSFLRQLAVFLTNFLKNHISLLEQGDDSTRQALIVSLTILLRLSRIDEAWIFKICLEYWNSLVADLYNTQRMFMPRSSPALMLGAFKSNTISPRLALYSGVLSQLRLVMIAKMAKPEEVLIVEDDKGVIVREELKDTDSITLYKSMREGLIYLTHLDPTDTQKTMLTKLSKQMDGSEWTVNNLNTLCWAIGSISGALSEPDEKTFLVKVIKDLLGLCEMKRGKDQKAVVASNIMYVVGQYPRFLRQHWKFLKTVVNKLFEFMHETHAGVQDMSVDTFLKIAKKCRKKFVVTQPSEGRPFIDEILEFLPQTIKDLEQRQVYVFYKAAGEIIQAEADPDRRQILIFKLMEYPNQSWVQIITSAKHAPDSLWDSSVVKKVGFVLTLNVRAAESIGPGYIVQLARIYIDMLQLYKMYSNFISAKIASEGSQMTKAAIVRFMRVVKQETLNLIRTFVENAADADNNVILTKFLPELLEPVLDDYGKSVPDARDSEVLLLFATFTDRLQSAMVQFIPAIFESLFQCTLDMITKDFTTFPDHRVSLYKLLLSINQHAFPALLRFNATQFQLVIDSIIWAIKHLESKVADTGLQILLDLISNISTSEVANEFFKTYYVSLLQDLLGVLTDSFHKPGFRLQATVIAKLFQLVEQGQITAPLWLNPTFNPSGANFANNAQYVREITSTLLRKAFSNLSNSTIDSFVVGLFQLNNNITAFKNHLRDFLVELKEFSQEGDNQELYSEEASNQKELATQQELARTLEVPGLTPAAQLPTDENYQAVNVDEATEDYRLSQCV